MKTKILAKALAVLATLGAAAPAWAAAPEVVAAAAPAVENPHRLALVVGLGSPWGEVAITYQRRFGQTLALETGCGKGATGDQCAALPKLLFGSSAARFYVEAGPSLTLGDREPAGVWAAGEVGFEGSISQVTLGIGAGGSVLAAGTVEAPLCPDECATLGPGTVLPEVRLTAGFDF
jgi:hypothetical protein